MSGTHHIGPVSSTNGFVGAVTGNIVGNITGDVTGNVTGNLTGNVVSSSVNIGSGGALSFVKKVAVAVDPGNITTLTTLEVSVTVAGAAAADLVVVSPPAAIEAGLVIGAAYVSGANTVKLRLYNSTGADINPASGSWIFGLIR